MQEEVSPIEDINILKDILHGNIKISEIDDKVKKRLIILCENRVKEIDEKINARKRETQKLEEILECLEKIEEE